MSCVAMVLQGAGFASPAGAITPHTLNRWLIEKHEYRCDKGDCDNMILSAPAALSGGRMRIIGEWPASALPLTALPQLASRETAYVAHVHNPRTGHVNHFVLLTGYDAATDRFAVHDPGFAKLTYARANVSDVIMCELLPMDDTWP